MARSKRQPGDLWCRFSVGDALPVELSCSQHALLPRRLAVRKHISILGLATFKLKADIMVPDGTISLGASCKDTLFQGRISLDMPTRALLYRKKFDMPNGMVLAVDGGVQVADLPSSLERGSGGWWPQRTSAEAAPRTNAKPWDPLVHRVKPFLGVQLLVGSASGKSSTTLLGDGGVLVRKEIPLPRPIVGASWPRVAVKTFVSVGLPRVSTQLGVGVRGAFDAPQDALTISLHQYDLVVRL